MLRTCLAIVLLQSLSANAQVGSYSANANILATGKKMFELHCATCHNFKQDGIGPNLAGVTSNVSYAWLEKFIISAHAGVPPKETRLGRCFEAKN